jgi:hypothetical protein
MAKTTIFYYNSLQDVFYSTVWLIQFKQISKSEYQKYFFIFNQLYGLK